jgi:hypothetical protein
MDLEKIEEAMRKVVESLDKGTRLEAVLKEDDQYRVILSKGVHSDRAVLSKDLAEDFLERGRKGQELKRALGKVISKLSLMNRPRG